MSKASDLASALLIALGFNVSSGKPGVRGHCGTSPKLRRRRETTFRVKPSFGKIKNIRGTFVDRPRHASSILQDGPEIHFEGVPKARKAAA